MFQRLMPVSTSSMSHSITLADVAKAAHVSIATASKALNGRQDVAEHTRNKVQEVAAQLGFVPNTLAKSLLEGKSGTVGLVTHDLEGRFSIPLLMGAEDAFGLNKLSVLLCDARGDSMREGYHLTRLIERRVDGLIIVGARPDARPSAGFLPVPIVYAYAPSSSTDDCSVISDNFEAGRLAVEHLLCLGRTRIAIIGGDPSYGAATERADGARDRLAASGLEPVGRQVLYGTWSERWGRAAAKIIIGRNELVDGVICGNDQIARGVLDVFRDVGKNVPEDVAVMGHDNRSILVEESRPPLTSIDMNLEDIGRTAARKLAEAIDGSPTKGVIKIAPRVKVRSSTIGHS